MRGTYSSAGGFGDASGALVLHRVRRAMDGGGGPVDTKRQPVRSSGSERIAAEDAPHCPNCNVTMAPGEKFSDVHQHFHCPVCRGVYCRSQGRCQGFWIP